MKKVFPHEDRGVKGGILSRTLLLSMAAWVVVMTLGTPASGSPAGKLQVNGGCATFTTDRMIVTVERGAIVRIFNRLTGSDYIVKDAKDVPRDLQTALVYAAPGVSKQGKTPSVVGGPVVQAASKVLVPTPLAIQELPQLTTRQIAEGVVEYNFRSEDGKTSLTLTYSLEPATGDLLITEKGEGAKGGLSAIRFGLGPVTCRGDLLLPAFNGIKASRGKLYKFESRSWEWPTGWELPLIIFNDPVGGFWVHSEDTQWNFKSVKYHYAGDGSWDVAFDTINAAPFAPHTAATSVTWHLNAYVGNWTVPVERYKQWASTAYRLAQKARFHPAWTNNIRLVIKHADYIPDKKIVPYLDLMRKHVDPAKTLLFMTHWEDPKAGYMPHWVIGEHGIKFNSEARKRGFRTMYFANYIGMTSNCPCFEQFESHVIRDPYTHDRDGWNLTGEWAALTPIKLYYVNPAYKPWRDYETGQFEALLRSYPADGLFLDQAFLMFNDDNGLIHGQNTVQGNLAYHGQLAEAVPGIALGGESVNEITAQYESFVELHFLSLHVVLNRKGKSLGWEIDPGAFDRMVPLVPKYILPLTHPIGYLAFPPTSSPYYAGWRDALHVYEGIPTITRPTMEEMRDPNSEVSRVMRETMDRQ